MVTPQVATEKEEDVKAEMQRIYDLEMTRIMSMKRQFEVSYRAVVLNTLLSSNFRRSSRSIYQRSTKWAKWGKDALLDITPFLTSFRRENLKV